MSLNNNPQIVTNGLAFYYDLSNKKSYLGPTIQNLTNSITVVTGSSSGFQITSASELVDIPTVGPINVQIANIRNNYPSVSNNCCPAPFAYFNAGRIAISSSTLYTYAILYRVESNYTHPNFMYRYEYNSSDGYLTESGVHNDSNRVNLGHGWYWAWGTFTSQSTATKLDLYSFYYRYSDSFDKMSVAKILLVQGNYTGLHPRFWPNFGTTRSNTQNILDLTGNNTITASSLTYASDGTFSFNGSNSISIPNPLNQSNLSQVWTVQAWVNISHRESTVQTLISGLNQGIHLEYVQGYNALIYLNSGTNDYYTYGYSNGFADQGWCLATFRFNNSTGARTIWRNLIEIGNANGPNNTSTPSGQSSTFTIGESVLGSIGTILIYNRYLTDVEVQQNFSALRGRYGV